MVDTGMSGAILEMMSALMTGTPMCWKPLGTLPRTEIGYCLGFMLRRYRYDASVVKMMVKPVRNVLAKKATRRTTGFLARRSTRLRTKRVAYRKASETTPNAASCVASGRCLNVLMMTSYVAARVLEEGERGSAFWPSQVDDGGVRRTRTSC